MRINPETLEFEPAPECPYCDDPYKHSSRCRGVKWDGREVRRCTRGRQHSGLCRFRGQEEEPVQ